MIENILNVIGVDVKRIADALEKFNSINEKTVKGTIFVDESVKTKTKPKKAAKKKEKPAVKEEPPEVKVSVDDLDGEVSTLTADDVKAEAKKLVDHTPNSRKGYEKAENIIKELGAASLKAIVPEKYEIAISLFRKAITEWK